MKRIITLLAVLAASITVAHAQADTVMTVDVKGEGLNVNIAGLSVTLQGDKNANKEKSNQRRRSPYRSNVFGLRCGVTRLADTEYSGNWVNQGDFLCLSGKSNTMGIEPLSWDISLDRRGITWVNFGTDCTWEKYHFFNPITLMNDENGKLMPQKIDGEIAKNKMNLFYFGTSLGFSVEVKRVKLGVKASPEILCFAQAKYKNPEKHTAELQGLNPVRLKLGMTMMMDVFGVYVDYGLTPMFKPDVGSEAKMFSMGLKFGF